MITKIIINNAITLGIHAVFCVLIYLATTVIWDPINQVYFNVTLVLFAIVIPVIYVMFGKLLLQNTGSWILNVLSVSILAGIVMASLFMDLEHFNLQNANMSFMPIGMFMLFFKMPEIVMYPMFALLPSTFLYIGMMFKFSGK